MGAWSTTPNTQRHLQEQLENNALAVFYCQPFRPNSSTHTNLYPPCEVEIIVAYLDSFLIP